MKNILMTFQTKKNVLRLNLWININNAKGKSCKLLESKQIPLMML